MVAEAVPAHARMRVNDRPMGDDRSQPNHTILLFVSFDNYSGFSHKVITVARGRGGGGGSDVGSGDGVVRVGG